MNELLALGAVALAGLSGPVGTIVGRRTRGGDRLFCGLMLLAAVFGLTAAVRSFARASAGPWSHPWSVPGGVLEVEVDALSGMFLAQIFLIGALGTIYGSGYWSAEEHPETAGRLRISYSSMVAGMALLVIARNSILFLVGWEIMAIAAFFSITTEDRDHGVREVGFVYLVATRAGTLFVFAAFAALRLATGSFSLSARELSGDTALSGAIFLFGLVGFGLKAGIMPLHIWLPGAHATAPSHVSALMSGVLIKMGIYGLMRTCASFQTIPLWWGFVLFALGMLSAVLGVVFAIGQHDLKRLLAYHSVENIGIIVIGFGIALIGRATGYPVLVALGMAGALLHVFNHGLFKALLFLSAGSVIRAAGTREIDALGGLGKKLPRTALAFLTGAVAICGLPPLNGFVSELFVYLAMLHASLLDTSTIGIATGLGVPVLALVGALAALCFVKVYGVVFSGEPRSSHGHSAVESPRSMLAPMAVLAALCVVIGALPLLVSPILERATSAWLGTASHQDLRALSPLGSLAWVNAALAFAVIVAALGSAKLRPSARVAHGPTWGCGYAAATARMQYTASSFAEWITGVFRIVLRPRRDEPALSGLFPERSSFESHVPEVVLDLAIVPAGKKLAEIATWFRWLQRGSVQLYLIYVLGALISMLFIWR